MTTATESRTTELDESGSRVEALLARLKDSTAPLELVSTNLASLVERADDNTAQLQSKCGQAGALVERMAAYQATEGARPAWLARLEERLSHRRRQPRRASRSHALGPRLSCLEFGSTIRAVRDGVCVILCTCPKTTWHLSLPPFYA